MRGTHGHGRRLEPGRPTPRQVQRFTLAEILVALVFVAVVVPVAVHGIRVASRVSIAADREFTAVELGESKLADLMLTGDWQHEDSDGDFGDEWPGYRWELVTETWEEDSEVLLTEVTLTVFFTVQGRDLEVPLTVLAESDTVEEETSTP